jgi:uncharacterized MAPEG superfamily protein
MLVEATALLLLLVLIQAAAGVQAQGALTLAGPRDNLPPPGVFQSRAKRVVDNHREGLTIFAPLVLAISIAHISSHWTVLGAELFFYSRVVHAVLYLAAVPLVRPLVWTVGLGGTLMILFAALGG